MKITLEMGDWSGDGHSISETMTVESNLNKKELLDAYKKGTKIVKFDLSNDVCEEYEDNSVDRDKWHTLVSLGFDESIHPDIDDYTVDGGDGIYLEDVGVYSDVFAEMWMFICKLGNPALDIKVCKNDAHITIGGYGLFGT